MEADGVSPRCLSVWTFWPWCGITNAEPKINVNTLGRRRQVIVKWIDSYKFIISHEAVISDKSENEHESEKDECGQHWVETLQLLGKICECPALDEKITAILGDVTQSLESSSTHDLWDWYFKMRANSFFVCAKILEVNKQKRSNFHSKKSKCQHTVLWKTVQMVSRNWLNGGKKYVLPMGFYEKIQNVYLENLIVMLCVYIYKF